MTSLCNICNKTYASSSSLWNHKNKIHHIKQAKNDVIAKSSPDVIVMTSTKTKACKYCNKTFYDRNNRNRHQKTCKAKDVSGSEFTELYNTVKELKKEIEVLKQNQKAPENQIINNIGQANTNCGTVNNNTINIIPIGKENLYDLLTEEQIAEILKLSLSETINKSLLLVYTADNLKSCRNTYISSLDVVK